MEWAVSVGQKIKYFEKDKYKSYVSLNTHERVPASFNNQDFTNSFTIREKKYLHTNLKRDYKEVVVLRDESSQPPVEPLEDFSESIAWLYNVYSII